MTDRSDGVGLDWERGRVLRGAGLGRRYGCRRGVGMGMVGRPWWFGGRRGGEVRMGRRCTAILVRTDREFPYS